MADDLQAAVHALRAGDLDRAERGFRQALTTDPANPAALINLGVVLRHKGRLDEAAEMLSRAAAADPTNFRTFANLGVTLQQARCLDEAIAAYRKAYRLEPRAIRQIAVNLSAQGTGTLFLDPNALEAFLAQEDA